MRLVPLAGQVASATSRAASPATAAPTPTAVSTATAAPTPTAAVEIGFKAARLASALRAGLPVLPGFVVPAAAARRYLQAAASAVRARGIPAGRLEILGRSIGSALSAELQQAVGDLGEPVIVRSSSPLEGDARWAGAFSSVTGVGQEDVAAAVRSCWASAFAVDPLRRLERCGLRLEALELAVLVQPEIVPEAGGMARVAGGEVTVEGVLGHPGPLLSGWAEGA